MVLEREGKRKGRESDFTKEVGSFLSLLKVTEFIHSLRWSCLMNTRSDEYTYVNDNKEESREKEKALAEKNSCTVAVWW